MAWWIEVRCENRENAPTKQWSHDETCWSHDNAGGGQLVNDTFRDLQYIAKKIAGNLKSSGWILTKNGWVCPFCVEFLKKKGGE